MINCQPVETLPTNSDKIRSPAFDLILCGVVECSISFTACNPSKVTQAQVRAVRPKAQHGTFQVGSSCRQWLPAAEPKLPSAEIQTSEGSRVARIGPMTHRAPAPRAPPLVAKASLPQLIPSGSWFRYPACQTGPPAGFQVLHINCKEAVTANFLCRSPITESR